MSNKSNLITRLIISIFINTVIIYFFTKMPNAKLALIPFLICSFIVIGKNIFLVMGRQDLAKLANKLFMLIFLIFWFIFIAFWCYTSIKDNEYLNVLFSLPFWLVGIVILKKNFFKAKSPSIMPNIKLNINLKKFVNYFLIIVASLAGIAIVFLAISNIYNSNKKTNDYITTTGYYNKYKVNTYDKNGTTYMLTYMYKVNDKEYFITTKYGTSYIPDENNTRDVKYNPDNPNDAVLVGTNEGTIFICIVVFFALVIFIFVLIHLKSRGYFDKFKIDIIGTYIGIVMLILGIGIILFQNGTTISITETIKSFGLFIFIPFMFIIAGIFQIVKCLFLKK